MKLNTHDTLWGKGFHAPNSSNVWVHPDKRNVELHWDETFQEWTAWKVCPHCGASQGLGFNGGATTRKRLQDVLRDWAKL